MLSEFTSKGQQQADLFAPSSAQSDALMAVMDQIKAKGLGRVGFASQGTCLLYTSDAADEHIVV